MKQHAHAIVKNEHFTPERIRRFVAEVLPELAAASEACTLSGASIKQSIDDAIHRPTDRMTKAFDCLPENHKLVLISLLDAGHSPSVDSLAELVSKRSGGSVSRKMLEQLIEELSESFIKVTESPS